jgi:hypothetical protein
MGDSSSCSRVELEESRPTEEHSRPPASSRVGGALKPRAEDADIKAHALRSDTLRGRRILLLLPDRRLCGPTESVTPRAPTDLTRFAIGKRPRKRGTVARPGGVLFATV